MGKDCAMTTSGPNPNDSGASDVPPATPVTPDYGTPPATKGPQYLGPAPSPEEKQMGMLAHLLGIIGFVGPLIIWLIKKDQSPFVDDQGKEALNFHLTMLIAY